MPRITQSKINNVFSFSTGSWSHWSDESEKPEEHFDSESEESQSIDSDHSSDFWFNWSPEIDKMIIKTRATYLEKLEAQIERDNETFRLLGICFRDQRPLENNEMQQFASIVLRDGLVDLDRIEAQIAKDEVTLQKLQPPPVKVSIVNVLKEAPKQKDPLVTYWKFPCRSLGKEPAVPKGTSWKARRTNKSQHSTPDGLTPGSPPEPETTY